MATTGDTSPGPTFSIVIPYRRRAGNLRLVLESLTEQTLPKDRFEVVLGVLENSKEYGEEYLALCREFSGRLNVLSVLADKPWQVGYARNLALRQSSGDVIVLLDADVILPPSALATLAEGHFAGLPAGEGEICAVGQLVDYDNNTSDVESVVVRPFEHYRGLLADLEAAGEVRLDPRLSTPHVIPWSFAWTALIALPRRLVERHDLWFDLNFHGYGVEDLEWAYRISATGTPVVMAPDLFGIHLPHARSTASNRRTEEVNYRYFLRKWPAVDVELACAFGDFEANAHLRPLLDDVREATGEDDASLAVVSGTSDGVSTLVVGVVVDARGRFEDPGVAAIFDATPEPEVLPLIGLRLPWPDDGVDQCRVLPPVGRLGPTYRDRVFAEARRVARLVVTGKAADHLADHRAGIRA